MSNEANIWVGVSNRDKYAVSTLPSPPGWPSRTDSLPTYITMSSDEADCPVPNASQSGAGSDISQALPVSDTQLDSHGRAAQHGTARSHSPPHCPSSSPHPSPIPPFSTIPSPLPSLSRGRLLPPEHGALASGLHMAIPSTQPSSGHPPPSAPHSLATSRLACLEGDTDSTSSDDKLVEDLVDPLLLSFASLHVQDGVASEATDIPSPPLWYVHTLSCIPCSYYR